MAEESNAVEVKEEAKVEAKKNLIDEAREAATELKQQNLLRLEILKKEEERCWKDLPNPSLIIEKCSDCPSSPQEGGFQNIFCLYCPYTKKEINLRKKNGTTSKKP